MKNFVCYLKQCRKNGRVIFVFLCLFLLSFFLFPFQIQAIKVGEMPIGSVILLGGYKFLKITSHGLFVTINSYPGDTFQTFNSTQCNSLTTCHVGDDCNTNGSTITLTDARDGKSYRIRKFADGNCWMIDNLAYGGSTTDGCSGKSTFDGGYTSVGVGYSVYGVWTGSAGTSSESFYGSCEDPKGMTCSGPTGCDSTYCTTHNCGYYYSWQAATQNSLAYYGNTYQPVEPTQGICPAGWQLPTGTGDNSFQALHSAMGYTTNGPYTTADNRQYWNCNTGCTGFWQSPGSWAGLLSGYALHNGAIYNQSLYGHWWSSSQYSSIYSYFLGFRSGWVSPQHIYAKSYGFSVRCLSSP